MKAVISFLPQANKMKTGAYNNGNKKPRNK